MRFSLALMFLLGAAATAHAKPANTLNQMFNQLGQCLKMQGLALQPGSKITLRFSLKRDGSLNGEPRITYAKLPDNEEDRKRDASTITASLGHCLPMSISDALGGAIAGQPLSVMLSGTSNEQGV